MADLASQLDTTRHRLTVVTTTMSAQEDVEAALANSAVYLEAFGHIVIGFLGRPLAFAARCRIPNEVRSYRAALARALSIGCVSLLSA